MATSRNAILGITLGCLSLLAACSQALAPTPIPPTTSQSSEVEETPEADMSTTEEARVDSDQDARELDLRFANVTGVEVEHLTGEEYRFSVTLHHDDDGEAPNFADAWQVEDLQGNVLGRRDLLHSHGSQPFTRSATITIPAGVDTVLVRGHDMTHGFGGQALQINLSTGEGLPLDLDSAP